MKLWVVCPRKRSKTNIAHRACSSHRQCQQKQNALWWNHRVTKRARRTSASRFQTSRQSAVVTTNSDAPVTISAHHANFTYIYMEREIPGWCSLFPYATSTVPTTHSTINNVFVRLTPGYESRVRRGQPINEIVSVPKHPCGSYTRPDTPSVAACQRSP